MNREDTERAMDLSGREADIIHRTDLYDSANDARSEAWYEDDPRVEPQQTEVSRG